jgi:hypothetical protein
MGYWKNKAIEDAEKRRRPAHKWDKPFGWRNPPDRSFDLYCYRCGSWRKQDPEHPDKRKYIYSDGKGNQRNKAGYCGEFASYVASYAGPVGGYK